MTVPTKVTKVLSTLARFDHRTIGARQKLFFFNEFSQGSCFFLPRGAHIYNKLTNFLREEYKTRGYEEVITPNIYNCQLWKESGHWDHYEDNMIKFDIGEKVFTLKPMNCPGHCLMFKEQKGLSSDLLPIRWADFGVLHRNEQSGALLGLTRARRFQQDDAHIFCTPDQVENEVRFCLNFAKHVYGKFGFSFEVKLSLRPEKYMGDEKLWDKAEQALREALKTSNVTWEEQKFEGAFYGPKIDLVIKDCRQKHYQCATIQLDFQLPERFELVYKDLKKNSLEQPVIIHRAILGSLERFIAMLAENCEGMWPFWLSPLQAQVIPVHAEFNNHAKHVKELFREQGLWVDCDLRPSLTFNAKIREALMTPYHTLFIVGQNEVETSSVTCRLNEDESDGEKGARRVVHNINISIEQLISYFKDFEERSVDRADLELLKIKNA